jgi:uncharacterized membrane-anchored protein
LPIEALIAAKGLLISCATPAADRVNPHLKYKNYELLINAERCWNRVKNFNAKTEAIREIQIEQKFRDIMVNDRWLEITDYDREMYNKALNWANSYNPKQSQKNIDKTAIVAAGSGAVTGAVVSNTIGGIGVAVGGTAFGVGMLGLTVVGTMAGLAAYGISKALD